MLGFDVVSVDPGVYTTGPVGTHFQFRSFGYRPFAAFGVTIPPWQDGDAECVEGEWPREV